jgi:DNA polymerase-4
MDAFYASVEQRDNPALRGKPVAVGGSPQGRGVVAAASYEARAFGVRSAMPMARALRLCPRLQVVRASFDKYKEASRQVMDILRSCTPLVEPLSLDEAYLDVTENLWHEPLATNIARRLKNEILASTGLTASAGVAPNKFLAKIASGWKKPDGLTVISPARVEKFLQQLPVEALWGVGPVTAARLKKIGVERLVDVREVDDALLLRTVGSSTAWLQRLAWGEDDRPVKPDRETKSVSSETTFPKDLRDFSEIRKEIESLAKEVSELLVRKHLAARTVSIKVRYDNFMTVTRSHTAQGATNSARSLSTRARILLERTEAGRRPVRLLGVGAHGLQEEKGSEQFSRNSA